MDNNTITADTPPANTNNQAGLHGSPVPLIVLCRQFDRLEHVTQERVGGATDIEQAEIDSLLAQIERRPADSYEAAIWRGNFLARAVFNDWGSQAVREIARRMQEDAALLKVCSPMC